MALTIQTPNTIMLSDPSTYTLITSFISNELARAGVAITPGMLVEPYYTASENKWRPNSSALDRQAMLVAIDKPSMLDNTGIDDVIAIGEDVHVAAVHVGAVFNGIVVNGATVAGGSYLQSNGDGKLKLATAATQASGLSRLYSLEALGTVGADTRCRVLVTG